MSARADTVAGVVLAGGRSRRMGGTDKALLELGGKSLIAHVIERLTPQIGRMVVSANGDLDRFSGLGLDVLADTVPGHAGPLAGILAALRWSAAATPGITHVASVPADTPFLPADLVARLAAAAERGPEALAVAASGGRTHPVVGLWPISAAAEIEAALARGEHAVHRFVEQRHAIAVEFRPLEVGGRAIDPFFNINTPEDLEQARGLLAASKRGAASAEPGRPAAVIGIAGWKGSGKTTLVERLVAELSRRGLAVSTVKHAHHELRLDSEGTDSARHRRAGARETAVVSPTRWCIGDVVHEGPEPALSEVIARLSPCDLVLVEGYKSAPIPKIEVRRCAQAGGPPLAEQDPLVIAVGADYAAAAGDLPVFALDDIDAIATFIARRVR